MPKSKADFPEQINLLTMRGQTEMLIAISYFRGQGNHYAGPARDFISRGIREFIDGLNDKDRKVFEEVLENVRIARMK